MGKQKYTLDLKLEIVNHFFDDHFSKKELAQIYKVDKGDIQKWTDVYREHGIDGLNNNCQKYTGEFKVSVVEYMHNTGASARKTAAHFNINSHVTVCNWEQIYDEQGPDALFEEHRGRRLKMGTQRPKRPRPKKGKKDNEDLEAEVKRLRMENEYLKKLNALVREREASEKKTK